MADIKVKDVAKKTVKAIDKSAIATERFKDTIVHTKERAENATSEDGNINEYGSSKISFVSNRTVDESVHQFNKQGKKSLIQTKDNIQKSKIKIKAFKEKRLAKKTIKGTTKGVAKNTKTAIKTSKEVAKNTKRVAQQSVKASQRAVKLARETAKATARGVKVAVKATISAVKAIIAGTKALIAALVAGGWVAVVAIIIICLVGLLCSSIFGIFFSSEDTGGSKTMNTVVNEINQEMANKITNIQNNNTYD
ncbi:MAG: CHAP domain-containing protein, partial [Clostridia bacterium]|nr:CHAP domain-containing protein [Clostridia bacterium]